MKGLARIRKLANISQSQLAAAMGVDRTAVAKWETCAAAPPAAKLPKLAQILGCTIDALFVESTEEAT